MPDISKIQLPNGSESYNIKDTTARTALTGSANDSTARTALSGSAQDDVARTALTGDAFDSVAREAIAGGVQFIIAWPGPSTVPVPANIPQGVKVVYNGTTYTGTLSADNAQPGAFYLVKEDVAPNRFDEYVAVGTSPGKGWEQIGSPDISLQGLVTDVTTTGYHFPVLNGATTVTNSPSSVTFGTPTTDKVLGENTTFTVTQPTITVVQPSIDVEQPEFTITDPTISVTQPTITVTPTTAKIVGTNGSVSIPNVTGNTNVTIPNVTGNADVTSTKISSYGTASTWAYNVANETLTISGANSTVPSGTDVTSSKVTLGTALSASKVTLGTAISAAKLGSEQTFMTGATATATGGSATASGTDVTASEITATASGASATATGAAVSANKTSDSVSAVTAMPTATAAAQTAEVNGSFTTVLTGINVIKHN